MCHVTLLSEIAIVYYKPCHLTVAVNSYDINVTEEIISVHNNFCQSPIHLHKISFCLCYNMTDISMSGL